MSLCNGYKVIMGYEMITFILMGVLIVFTQGSVDAPFIYSILKLMSLIRISKVASYNIIFLLLFLSIVEYFFGNWRKNFFGANRYIQIPHLTRNKTYKYDVKSLYSSNKPVNIVYKRDEFGYRSRDLIPNKPLVLTIGGSTTDQKYVNEGKTFQDILDLKFKKYDFINGGVDGQSSYGHLLSISNWHSKFLNKDNNNFIIFYIGINDRGLVNQKFTDWDFAQSQKSYIKYLLKDNSFFLSKILVIRNRIKFILSKKNNLNDLLISYTPREKDFKKIGIKYEFNENLNIRDYPKYTEIFSNLILQTRENFPKSKIFIIQQQIPGCNFINKNIVYDRHPDQSINYCADLLKVYKLQEKIFSESQIKKNIKLYPMYLQDIIKDDGVFDYVHTNNTGSRRIANYIESIINQK